MNILGSYGSRNSISHRRNRTRRSQGPEKLRDPSTTGTHRSPCSQTSGSDHRTMQTTIQRHPPVQVRSLNHSNYVAFFSCWRFAFFTYPTSKELKNNNESKHSKTYIKLCKNKSQIKKKKFFSKYKNGKTCEKFKFLWIGKCTHINNISCFNPPCEWLSFKIFQKHSNIFSHR